MLVPWRVWVIVPLVARVHAEASQYIPASGAIMTPHSYRLNIQRGQIPTYPQSIFARRYLKVEHATGPVPNLQVDLQR